jgi:hypothetical protein
VLKKAYELSILCDTNVAIIAFSLVGELLYYCNTRYDVRLCICTHQEEEYCTLWITRRRINYFVLGSLNVCFLVLNSWFQGVPIIMWYACNHHSTTSLYIFSTIIVIFKISYHSLSLNHSICFAYYKLSPSFLLHWG